jgi:hypothetical protein
MNSTLSLPEDEVELNEAAFKNATLMNVKLKEFGNE